MWKWTVESSAAFSMSDQLQQCPSVWSELILTWHQLGIVVDHLQLGEATQEILLYQINDTAVEESLVINYLY